MRASELIYFNEMHRAALAIVSRMKIDLSAYAEKPTASENFINKRNEEIAIFKNYFDFIEELINRTDAEAKKQRAEGYREGHHAAEKYLKGEDIAQHNKEVKRLHSINQARTTWENLT